MLSSLPNDHKISIEGIDMILQPRGFPLLQISTERFHSMIPYHKQACGHHHAYREVMYRGFATRVRKSEKPFAVSPKAQGEFETNFLGDEPPSNPLQWTKEQSRIFLFHRNILKTGRAGPLKKNRVLMCNSLSCKVQAHSGD